MPSGHRCASQTSVHPQNSVHFSKPGALLDHLSMKKWSRSAPNFPKCSELSAVHRDSKDAASLPCHTADSTARRDPAMHRSFQGARKPRTAPRFPGTPRPRGAASFPLADFSNSKRQARGASAPFWHAKDVEAVEWKRRTRRASGPFWTQTPRMPGVVSSSGNAQRACAGARRAYNVPSSATTWPTRSSGSLTSTPS